MCFDEPLLTRDEFREAVFARDGYKCVVCGSRENGLDAHHIIDRKLFYNGGYYLSNGVSLCEECHLLAETSQDKLFSPRALRKKAGIMEVILPPGLDPTYEYDKWGVQVKYPYQESLDISNPYIGVGKCPRNSDYITDEKEKTYA